MEEFAKKVLEVIEKVEKDDDLDGKLKEAFDEIKRDLRRHINGQKDKKNKHN